MFVSLTNSRNLQITVNTSHIKYIQNYTAELTRLYVDNDLLEVKGAYDDIVFIVQNGCSKETYAQQTDLW